LSESRILADFTDFADFRFPVYLTPFVVLSLPIRFSQYILVWFGEKIYSIRKASIHGGFTEVFLVARGPWLPSIENRRSP